MTTTLRRRGSGELGVEVDVEGARDVLLAVVVAAVGIAELPPHVEDDRGRIAGAHEEVQFGGGGQHGEALERGHAMSSATAMGASAGESRSRSRKSTTVAAAVRWVTSLRTSCRVPARLTSSAPGSAL